MTDCFGSTLPESDRLQLSSKSSNRVTIENDVWIGDNSVVLSGVSLPTGTIVGAGSVVTKSPQHPFSIIVGNPARHLRFRFTPRSSLVFLIPSGGSRTLNNSPVVYHLMIPWQQSIHLLRVITLSCYHSVFPQYNFGSYLIHSLFHRYCLIDFSLSFLLCFCFILFL